MKRLKNISVTVAVILVTALNIFNIERPVPGPQLEYDNYAYSYLLYMSLSFIILSLCYFVSTANRVVKALLIINFGEFLILAVKSYFHVSYKHNYYDHTFLGCAIIIAFYYLLAKHQKQIFISIKEILNQIYMRWPRKSQKKPKDYS